MTAYRKVSPSLLARIKVKLIAVWKIITSPEYFLLIWNKDEEDKVKDLESASYGNREDIEKILTETLMDRIRADGDLLDEANLREANRILNS